ncbi:heme exporter protein CcmD [Devosia epidermidihirudinis]|uniref:heme exporter protein CcmD n=1 Tax=Devosia epidermidihirudinis TaxID=1293439 RepID=UPI0009E50E70|nr:heme exporter protein CcmD [Devosia epidermidihirudinis]
MIELGPHAVFIVWAYIGVIIGVGGLIGWTLYDARRTDKKLADLEARGIRRRSAGPAA